MRILIVEDDLRTAGFLDRALNEAGHVVDRVGDGATGLAMACEGIYDALVLDRLLPEMDGLALTRALRERGVEVPILMLSALAGARDKVEGLQAGVDDYLAKPFCVRGFQARLEVVLRRKSASQSGQTLKAGDLELDVVRRRAVRGGQRIDLQYRECLLLETLLRHHGQVVTRSMLIEAAWPYDFEPRGNIIDMHIHRLRQKIDDGFAAALIQTVPGAGYVLKASDTAV